MRDANNGPSSSERQCALEYTLGVLAWITINAYVYSLTIGHCSPMSM